jgi:ATP-dependent DNA helicase PIF1
LSKFGFPTPRKVPTEVEEAILKWCNEDEMERQGDLLASLKLSCTNNAEQQNAYNNIMNSIDEFRNTDQDLLTSHRFHFIGGPGGTGKSALFTKLHTACCSKGLLIAMCAAMSLAALSFEGAVTAHSLFGYPVEDKEYVDDLNPTRCEVKKERADFLHEVSVIFWDEYIFQ